MTWFKVDDGFYDHPKTEDLPLEAAGLWLMGGTYCARHLTDGFITHARCLRFGATDDAIDALLQCGLWLPESDGYRFRDWHDYQPTRESVLAQRERERERKARHREAKRNAANVPGGVPAGVPVGHRAESQGVSGDPDPTRPDPTKKRGARKRATPAPQSLPITDEMRAWADKNAPGVDLETETTKLLDYARANGKSYKDWYAAWRNWMRRAPQFARNTLPGNQPTRTPPVFDPDTFLPTDAVPMPNNVRSILTGESA